MKTVSNPSSEPEVFLLELNKEQYCLYAPLRRKLALLNNSAARVVADYLKNPEFVESDSSDEIIGKLSENGFFEPLPADFARIEGAFQPIETTLFLTGACNLACGYCYADAGESSINLPLPVAKSAIDFISQNALSRGGNFFRVNFHGGGEPSLAWDLLTQCVAYAGEVAKSKNLEVRFNAASNGVLNTEQRRFFIDNFNSLNISLDGPPDIQNMHRPLRNGGDSYTKVHESLKDFDKQSFNYAIRSTISASTVSRMREISEYFTEEFECGLIHFEPLWSCQRSAGSALHPPRPQDFIDNFIEASKWALERGIQVVYSGARLENISVNFCALSMDPFAILPEGIVSACYEITSRDDLRAELFHFGEYDFEKAEFHIDERKRARLRKMRVDNFPFCENCFCKWHCAGDCLAKALGDAASLQHEGGARCEINRALTFKMMEDLLESAIKNEHGSEPIIELPRKEVSDG